MVRTRSGRTDYTRDTARVSLRGGKIGIFRVEKQPLWLALGRFAELPGELRNQIYRSLAPEKPRAYRFDEYVALRLIQGYHRQKHPRKHQPDSEDAGVTRWATHASRMWGRPWRAQFPGEPGAVPSVAAVAIRHLDYYLKQKHQANGALSTPSTMSVQMMIEMNSTVRGAVIDNAAVCFHVDSGNIASPSFGYDCLTQRDQIGRVFFYIDMSSILLMQHPTLIDRRAQLGAIGQGIANIISTNQGLREFILHIRHAGPLRQPRDLGMLRIAGDILGIVARRAPRPPVQVATARVTYPVRPLPGAQPAEHDLCELSYDFRAGDDPPAWVMQQPRWLGAYDIDRLNPDAPAHGDIMQMT